MSGWAPVIEDITLVSASGGRFHVTLDGEVLFSKQELGRHAKEGEITDLVRERIGDEVMET